MKWPEDYPFPESVLGRGRDFRSVIALIWYCIRSISIASNRACWFIAMEVGVSSIPVSEVSMLRPNCSHALHVSQFHIHIQFYCEEHTSIGESYARFAFCKDVDTLKHAAERLQKLKQYLA